MTIERIKSEISERLTRIIAIERTAAELRTEVKQLEFQIRQKLLS